MHFLSVDLSTWISMPSWSMLHGSVPCFLLPDFWLIWLNIMLEPWIYPYFKLTLTSPFLDIFLTGWMFIYSSNNCLWEHVSFFINTDKYDENQLPHVNHQCMINGLHILWFHHTSCFGISWTIVTWRSKYWNAAKLSED